MLRHALDVLLDNALNHGEGEVRIDQHVGTDTVTITVADEGPGFADPCPDPRRALPPTVASVCRWRNDSSKPFPVGSFSTERPSTHRSTSSYNASASTEG